MVRGKSHGYFLRESTYSARCLLRGRRSRKDAIYRKFTYVDIVRVCVYATILYNCSTLGIGRR